MTDTSVQVQYQLDGGDLVLFIWWCLGPHEDEVFSIDIIEHQEDEVVSDDIIELWEDKFVENSSRKRKFTD